MNTQFCVCVCCSGWGWSLLVVQNLEEVLHLFQTENASLSFLDSLSTGELKHLKHWAVTHQHWCLLVTCFPLSRPGMSGCCGTRACAPRDPKKSLPHYCTHSTSGGTGSVLQTTDRSVDPRHRLKLPAARREAAHWSHGSFWAAACSVLVLGRWPGLRTGCASWGCSDVTKCGSWLRAGVRLTLCCMTQSTRENFSM